MNRIRRPRNNYPLPWDPRSKTGHLRMQVNPSVRGFGWPGVEFRVMAAYRQELWALDRALRPAPPLD